MLWSIIALQLKGRSIMSMYPATDRTGSSVAAVVERDTKLIIPLAKDFNMSLTSFGQKISTVAGPTSGSIELSDAWGTSLEPAPKTPVDEDAAPFKLLSGTIISTYQNSQNFQPSGKPIIVTPAMGTGKSCSTRKTY